ncbi:MAG: periplasmic heavy metal sensor [Myxococcota bacterium]|nr:periplasmic heavy metal sensor [Myxococcota bacterium]
MTSRSIYMLLILSITLALPSLAAAEPPPERAPPSHEPGTETESREDLMNRIRLVRMYAITEALDLDEATAAKLFPALREQDDAIKALHQSKQEHRKALRGMMKSESYDRKVVADRIDALSKVDVQIAQARADQVTKLKRILTPEQQVKFVLVRERLENEIRRTIREHRRERRNKGPRERRAPRP